MSKVLSFLKGLPNEATTWAGVAMLAKAASYQFSDHNHDAAIDAAIAGASLIVLKGRGPKISEWAAIIRDIVALLSGKSPKPGPILPPDPPK